MIRQHVIPRSLQGERYFVWRGGAVSRIEALSDAVFALALTLLIVSLSVPRTFDELLLAFEQLPVFAVCCAMLMMCWYYHYKFHRRYGLEDFLTIVLNSFLLFAILIYVYPLKFLFSLLFRNWFGLQMSGSEASSAISGAQWPMLMLIYSAGVAFIFGLFALLNVHAYRKREPLGLNGTEIYLTRVAIIAHLISVCIALTSILLVLIDRSFYPWAGVVYFLMGPLHAIHGYRSGAEVERRARSAGPVVS